MFVLGKRSRDKLKGVHPDLVRVVERAIQITKQDFMVTEGVRTLERQKQLGAQRASRTMNSRHLSGHAVDLAAWVNGTVNWDPRFYDEIKEAMYMAARDCNVPLRWGGDWDGDGDRTDQTFHDLVHFELPASRYPAEVQVRAKTTRAVKK